MKRNLVAALVTAVALVLFAGPAGATPVDGPIAVDDSYSVPHGQTLNVSAPGVLANDSDPNGATLIVTSYTPAAHGASWMNPDGSFGWTPGSYIGTDTIVYGIFNGLSSATGTVYLESTNTAPTVVDDTYSVHAGGMLSPAAPGLLANDSDFDGDPLTAGMIVGPTHGWAIVYADGSFTYTPQFSFIGQDSFWYWAYDPSNAYGYAYVTIDVLNDVPTAVDHAYTVPMNGTLNKDAPGLFYGAHDGDDDPLFLFAASPPLHGSVVLDEFSGAWQYTPDPDYFGPDSFDFFVSDFWAPSAVHTVELTVAAPNLPPAASDDSYAGHFGQDIVVAAPGVLGNDVDPEGQPLYASVLSGPSAGSLVLNDDGSFTYTPEPTFIGVDEFTYLVTDSEGDTDEATVRLELTNTRPTAVDQEYSTAADTAITVPGPGFLDGAADADGDPLAGFVLAYPLSGTLDWDYDGSFTYTPPPGFGGDVSFQFTAYDGTESSDTHVVTIHVVSTDQPPVAAADSYTARKNNVLTVDAAHGVLANDSDPNGDPMTAVKVSGPAHGALVFNANGSFKYTPTRGFAGLDSFTYKVLANGKDSATVTVTLNVTVPKK